jgi:hypothetical protein
MRMLIAAALIAGTTACSGAGEGNQADNGVLPQGPTTNISEVSANSLPPALATLIQSTVPGMTVSEVDRKEREGRVYYDVEGKKPDGSEVELDVLEEGGTFRVVEIQRDIAWDAAPPAAIAAAKAKKGAFAPERVIESTQTDGSVIYELFAPGRKDEPAMEVRMAGGKAEVLGKRWEH